MADYIDKYTGVIPNSSLSSEQKVSACNSFMDWLVNTFTPQANIAIPLMYDKFIDQNGILTCEHFDAVEGDTDNTTEVQNAIDQSISRGVPLMDTIYKFRTGALSNIDKVQRVSVTPSHINLDIKTAKNVVFIGDSLTELRNSDSYVLDVVDGLSAHYGGYKEPSYIPFGSYRTEQFGGVISKSANMADMWGASDGNFGSLPFSYSPDGKGLYTNIGDGTDYVAINFYENYSFSKFKLFYLIQSGGGTFDIGSKFTAAENLTNIDTSGTTALGVVEFDMSNELERNIRIKNINGKVAIFGVEVVNDLQKGGFKYDVWARNGIKTSDFNNLHEVTTYESELLHDVAIINLGTNDANASVDVGTYASIISSYISKLTAGNPNLQIVILEPVQPQFYYSTGTMFQEYSNKRRELAEANGWGLIDTASAIGGYGELAGLGMMEDAVHPNEKGKKRVAEAVLDYLDVNTLDNGIMFDENKTYLTNTQEEQVYIVVNLTTTPQVVANLGMYDGSELLYVELEAMATAGSNGAYVKGNFDMGTFSATPEQSVGYVRDFKETYNEPIGASSSYNLDLSVQLSATNDCEISASTTGSLASTTLLLKIKSTSTKRKPNKTFYMVK